MRSATEEDVLTEQGRVERWRFEELVRGGFDTEAADALSICLDVNLRDAIRLLQDGCSQRMALRILL